MLLTFTLNLNAQTNKLNTDNLWELQQYCDEMLQSCDSLLIKQAQMYGKLKNQNLELQRELQNRANTINKLENVPVYKDPLWTGLAGIVLGIIIEHRR